MDSFPQDLLDGYHAFKTGKLAQEGERYRRLAEQGQAPETLIIILILVWPAPVSTETFMVFKKEG